MLPTLGSISQPRGGYRHPLFVDLAGLFEFRNPLSGRVQFSKLAIM
jgi:hypothetical protein